MTDIVKVAEQEIEIFERPSADTSKLLIVEVKKLRQELENCQKEKSELNSKYKKFFQKYRDLKKKFNSET